MKKPLFIGIIIVMSGLFAGTAAAVSQYWDISTDGGSQGGAGAWSTSAADMNWSDIVGTSLAAWTNGNDAVFPLNDGAPSEISVTGTVSAGLMTFNGSPFALIVTNGGQLSATGAVTFAGKSAVNSMLVTGSGSLWTNAARLTIGSNATVTVADGARLSLGDGFIMNTYGTVPCGLLITNGGQVAYSNTASMYILVGNSSPSNALIITGNGSMFAGPGDGPPGGNNWMYIGPFAGAMTGNSLRIENGGVFTNARLYVSGPNASLSISSGGKCYTTALNIFGGCVSVVGGAGVTSSISGGCNLAGRGATGIVDGAGFDGSAIVTAVMSLNGGGTVMNVINRGRVISLGGGGTYAVGQVSASNELVVAQGGFARFGAGSGYGGLGFGNGAIRNSMIVRDSGSVLELNANGGYPWQVGFGAAAPSTNYGNVIYVQDGGTLTNNAIINIASGLAGIPVSSNCFNNGIMVSSSGQVHSAANWFIGQAGSVTGNFAMVTGAGSYWDMGGRIMFVGTNGNAGNYLTVEQGGLMTNVNTLNVGPSNSVNVFDGGTLVANTLALQTNAMIGVDVLTTGKFTVLGTAYLGGGLVNPTHLPKRGKATCLVLTAGTLVGDLGVAPLPLGYTGSITTNGTGPYQVNLFIRGPAVFATILAIR